MDTLTVVNWLIPLSFMFSSFYDKKTVVGSTVLSVAGKTPTVGSTTIVGFSKKTPLVLSGSVAPHPLSSCLIVTKG